MTFAQTHAQGHVSSPALTRIAPFTHTSLATLNANATNDRPVVVMFWSLDCQHCSEGVAMLKQVQSKAQVVTVATDDISKHDELLHHLKHHNNTFPAYAFADTPEKLRYSVDKKWRGETPVIYVLNPAAPAVKFLGLPQASELRQAINAAP